jgi:hypothetical protein
MARRRRETVTRRRKREKKRHPDDPTASGRPPAASPSQVSSFALRAHLPSQPIGRTPAPPSHPTSPKGLLGLLIAVLALVLVVGGIVLHGRQTAPARREARRWRYAVLREVPLVGEALPDASHWCEITAGLTPALWQVPVDDLLPELQRGTGPTSLLQAIADAGLPLQRGDGHTVYADAEAPAPGSETAARDWCHPRYRRMLPDLPCQPPSERAQQLAPWVTELAEMDRRGWSPAAANLSAGAEHLTLQLPLRQLISKVWPDAMPLPATWPLAAEVAEATDAAARQSMTGDFSLAMKAAVAAVREGQPPPAMEASNDIGSRKDSAPRVTCRARFGHNGTELFEPWSTHHRLLVGLDGQQRVLLFPGNEAHTVGLLPAGHPHARQFRRSLRSQGSEVTQSLRGRPRAWVQPSLHVGHVLYVPPGWIPVLVPSVASLSAVCTLTSATDGEGGEPGSAAGAASPWTYSLTAELQRRALAAEPPMLYNASFDARDIHHALQMWAVVAAGSASDDFFASPHYFLRGLHRDRLKHVAFVYAEAPANELASHPPLQCAWRRPSSSRSRRPPPDIASLRRQIRTYAALLKQLYAHLPEASRQPLVDEVLDRIIANVGGLHNLFLFFASCF